MRRIVSTLLYTGRAPWDEVANLDRGAMSTSELFLALLRAGRDCDAMVLNGSVGLRAGYIDLLAAAAITRRRSAPTVVLADCTWSRGGWWLERFARRSGIRILDNSQVTYCVLSSEERELFPRTWQVDPGRVVFTPFHYTAFEEELDAATSEDGRVFAGGDSMRDYGPLIAAARRLPVGVTIATSQLDGVRHTLPSNVRAGRVSHQQFLELMRHARVVVIPMPKGIERSAGQQTYLNAMGMGKLVITTESPGARDYIEEGRTGLLVPASDSAALAAALDWALDPANRAEVRLIGSQAREVARSSFTPERYLTQLLEIVEQSLG